MTDLSPNSFPKRFLCLNGFTLLETMIVLAIIGVLTAIAIPNFLNYRENARIAAAVGDISQIAQKVLDFYDENKSFPATLADVGMGGRRDPWATPTNTGPSREI